MTRLDFANWLSTFSQVGTGSSPKKLALGETTGCVARMFRISVARVSQLRRNLCRKWQKFIGELQRLRADLGLRPLDLDPYHVRSSKLAPSPRLTSFPGEVQEVNLSIGTSFKRRTAQLARQ